MITLMLFACSLSLLVLVGLLGVLTAITLAWRGRKRNREAEEQAIRLLRSWLTPRQTQQWDTNKSFEVIGSDTGTRYCIRYGKAMNIDQLDSDGRVVARWCFAPDGKLALGDVMLAQKIALETMEKKALCTANWGEPPDARKAVTDLRRLVNRPLQHGRNPSMADPAGMSQTRLYRVGFPGDSDRVSGRSGRQIRGDRIRLPVAVQIRFGPRQGTGDEKCPARGAGPSP
jgi:hypothetical protein